LTYITNHISLGKILFNYQSQHPISPKKGIVIGMVDRMFNFTPGFPSKELGTSGENFIR